MQYLMELLSKKELSSSKIKEIEELINDCNEDYKPLINPCTSLPSGKSVYEVKLNKWVNKQDLEIINKPLKDMQTKLRHSRAIILIEHVNVTNKLELLEELINKELMFEDDPYLI